MNLFETSIKSPRGNSRILIGNGILSSVGEIAAQADVDVLSSFPTATSATFTSRLLWNRWSVGRIHTGVSLHSRWRKIEVC